MASRFPPAGVIADSTESTLVNAADFLAAL